MSTRAGVDSIGWFLITMHQMIGHRATADFLGQPRGDKADCILCQYEKGLATKAEVIERIGTA
jgi:hypothetical protein